ncbi:hypothetical protein ACIQFZ_28410 [Streptomyces sp. NPDC093064]|uniref:hypothetical protein n=1 Tax=unclassified Streptomyces TaxID=2593676 RepID=UPI0036A80C98
MEREQRDDGVEFGARVGQLLDGYARELPAPTDTLVTEGLVRGRRMKRRRQTLWGAAAFAGVSALTGAVVLSGGGTTGGRATQADGVVIPAFKPVAATSGAPDGKVALTGKQAVATLRGLLPGTPATSGYSFWDGPKEPLQVSAGGRLLVDGTEVAVSLQGNFQLTSVGALSKDRARAAAGLGVRQDKTGTAAPDKSAARKAQQDGTGKGTKSMHPATRLELQKFYSCQGRTAPGTTLSACTARNLGDGSVLITYEEHQGKLVRRTADLLRKDGTRIVLTAANAADGKRGPASTATPPLTEAQLAHVVGNAAWQPWVKPGKDTKSLG